MSQPWFISLAQIFGAILLATNVPISWVGYWIMLFGAFGGMTYSVRVKEQAFFTMWASFFFINLLGIVRWTPW